MDDNREASRTRPVANASGLQGTLRLPTNGRLKRNASAVCKGNRMISSAIWDKSAQENISKANNIARARRASAICVPKNLRVLIYPKLHEN